MRTIIAGSRGITDYAVVVDAIRASGLTITKVISGMARGVDMLGLEYARANSIDWAEYRAKWNARRTVIGPDGRELSQLYFDKQANYKRNRLMAENADALIAIWDGVSKGTSHMINIANEKGLHVYVHKV